MATIRTEGSSDVEAITQVNQAAFETTAEACLVDLLRRRGKLLISFVAENEGQVVRHIAFSRVSVTSSPGLQGLGLGPMAVIPSQQRQGIGSHLVRSGLQECMALRAQFVVVLGHSHYYPRFGFLPASNFKLSCTWPVPEGVFMVAEIDPGALANAAGLVSYEPEFNDL